MSTKDGYSVIDKAAKVGCPSDVALGDLGVSIPHLSNLNTMMAHHHRPFPSSARDGPTRNIDSCITSDNIYEVGSGSGGGGGGVSGVVCSRNYLQPFDFSKTATSSAVFKNPGGRMATSLGFPFTNAQWKELERQAMIYKYMMAPVSVPPHLLNTPSNLLSVPVTSFSLMGSYGLNLSLRNLGGDLEPGRCKRTDGKKWRCSRGAAPDQKYCERHLNRGRSRSRKPVELRPSNNTNLNTNNNTCSSKKTRLINTTSSEPELYSDKAGVRSQLIGSDLLQNSAFNKIGGDFAAFDAGSSFVSAYKEPTRELDWMVIGGPFPIAKVDQDTQWQHHVVMESSSLDFQEETSNFEVLGHLTSGESHQSTTFLDDVPQGFIDEWPSIGNPTNNLFSAGGSNAADEMGQIQISLGQIGSDGLASSSWPASTTPGGPLAEALNLSLGTTSANHTSPGAENGGFGISPAVTMVSSPSGVLQKTLAAFSDSSGNSSPTLARSGENRTEIASLWLDQCNGKLASAD